jgi:tetratricopeptide (TPR) repeat protein
LRKLFARIPVSSQNRGSVNGSTGLWFRFAGLCLVVNVMVFSVTGCSWLGVSSGGDTAVVVENGTETTPEQVAAARTKITDKLNRYPNEPYWPFRMGEIYAAVDSTEKSVLYLRAALDKEPGYAPAAALLSKLYYETSNFEAAVSLLDTVLARDPSAPDAIRAALALNLEALGDFDRASSVLDGCTGNSTEVRAVRTFVNLRGQNPGSSLETAKEALEIDSKSAVNHNNYGIALLIAGKPFEARESFREALRIDERLPGALYNMAIVEAFYFFDEQSGRRWFDRYKLYASDDPDDLETQLGGELKTVSNREATQ